MRLLAARDESKKARSVWNPFPSFVKQGRLKSQKHFQRFFPSFSRGVLLRAADAAGRDRRAEGRASLFAGNSHVAFWGILRVSCLSKSRKSTQVIAQTRRRAGSCKTEKR